MIRFFGRHTLQLVGEVGDFALFSAGAFVEAFRARRLVPRLVRAIYEQGIRCLPVILVVGLFTGLVLGLQGYYVLVRYGSAGALGTLVSLTLIRELGPVLAALMLVGQAGSALAAELGFQRNTEQIDALETMGISPVGYLVTPRFLASLITYPAMTAFFSLVGLVGGWLSGSFVLSLKGGVYWASIHNAVTMVDVRECMAKALVFGVLTTAVCCHNGYNAHRRRGSTGAKAVSASTTRAVVLSSISVLAADYVITSFLV
jgi:phospholipid/cholesterol/gamma-HCH transport system permease protein